MCIISVNSGEISVTKYSIVSPHSVSIDGSMFLHIVCIRLCFIKSKGIPIIRTS